MKDFMTKQIYFAGPRLSGVDYEIYARHISKKYRGAGIRLVLPNDGGAQSSGHFYKTNLNRIKGCDGVIADLNPFRGEIEPDCGTAFECGFAAALGKPIIAIVEDQRTLVQKMQASSLGCTEENGVYRSDEGDLIEDYGYPLNLMLFHASGKIVASLDEAIRYLALQHGSTKKQHIKSSQAKRRQKNSLECLVPS